MAHHNGFLDRSAAHTARQVVVQVASADTCSLAVVRAGCRRLICGNDLDQNTIGLENRQRGRLDTDRSFLQQDTRMVRRQIEVEHLLRLRLVQKVEVRHVGWVL